MDCRDCKESMTAFLDGELSPAERKGVEAHIDSCRACGELWNQHHLVAALTDRLTPIRPRPELWTRIEAEINAVEGPGFWEQLVGAFRRTWIPAAALGTVSVIILAVLLIPGTDPMEEEFQAFIEGREVLRKHHERLLFYGSFDRHRLGRNPFSIPVSLEYQNPFEE